MRELFKLKEADRQAVEERTSAVAERRVITIDVGHLSPKKQTETIQAWKEKLHQHGPPWK